MVFQSYALYPHMTVAKNIESPLVARKLRGRRRRTAPQAHQPPSAPSGCSRPPTTLGLTDLLGRKPAALSGGQRQRVALARAIVARPAAFLMDEPLSNLDAKLRAQTRLELVELHRRLATTFVYVTHDQVEAMTMADRIAVMNEGRLQQVGPPQAVYDRPHNLFVARFIGSPPMNTVPGTVVRTDGGTAVRARRPDHRHRAGHAPSRSPTAPRWSSASAPSTCASTPPARSRPTVRAVEWLGHERLVICDLAGHQITVRQPSSGDRRRGGRRRARASAADPGHVHLFDPATTERLN